MDIELGKIYNHKRRKKRRKKQIVIQNEKFEDSSEIELKDIKIHLEESHTKEEKKQYIQNLEQKTLTEYEQMIKAGPPYEPIIPAKQKKKKQKRKKQKNH